MTLQFFFQKNLEAKAACKMLAKLISGHQRLLHLRAPPLALLRHRQHLLCAQPERGRDQQVCSYCFCALQKTSGVNSKAFVTIEMLIVNIKIKIYLDI